MSDRFQVTREKLMQLSKPELVEDLLGALAVVVSLKESPEGGETTLKIIKSQAQQIEDGRTIYDAAHRENARLIDLIEKAHKIIERDFPNEKLAIDIREVLASSQLTSRS